MLLGVVMSLQVVAGFALAVVTQTSARDAPVYLDCVAFGKEFKDGNVHYAFTLNESAQSASVTVKETGYAPAGVTAVFSPSSVTVHKPGQYEADDYLIDRTSLSLTVSTTFEGKTYKAGEGTCKLAPQPKQKF